MNDKAPGGAATPQQLHNRLGSMIDQIGQPDYSLRDLVDGLRGVRDDLLLLSAVAVGKPLLYSADTQEYPGKVRLRFVTFTEQIVDQKDPAFLEGNFKLCDSNDPRVREFKETIK